MAGTGPVGANHPPPPVGSSGSGGGSLRSPPPAPLPAISTSPPSSSLSSASPHTSARATGAARSTKPFAKVFPPRLAPPPKAMGPKMGFGGRSPSQTVKFIVGLGCGGGSRGDADPTISPSGGASMGDDSEECPTASPGLLKTMKELDNQDQQQLFNGSSPPPLPTTSSSPAGAVSSSPVTSTPAATKPDSPGARAFKLHLQNTAKPDSNITADSKDGSSPRSRGVGMGEIHGEEEEKSAQETASQRKEKEEERQRFANSIGGLGVIDESKIAFIDETPVETLPQ